MDTEKRIAIRIVALKKSLCMVFYSINPEMYPEKPFRQSSSGKENLILAAN
jgi:hypothetical protein